MRFRFQRFDAFYFVLSSFRFVFVFRSPHLDSIITCVVWASCIQIYLVDPVDGSGSAYFAQETDIWHAFRCVPFVIWFIECRKWDMLVHQWQQQLQRSQPQNAAQQETNTNIFVDEIFTCALCAWLRRIRRLSRQEINWSFSLSLFTSSSSSMSFDGKSKSFESNYLFLFVVWTGNRWNMFYDLRWTVSGVTLPYDHWCPTNVYP